MSKLDKAIELLEPYDVEVKGGYDAEWRVIQTLELLRELRDQPKSGAEIIKAWRKETDGFWTVDQANKAWSDLAQRIDDALVSRQTDEPQSQRDRWQLVADLTGCVVTGDRDGCITLFEEEPLCPIELDHWIPTGVTSSFIVIMGLGTWTQGNWQDRIVRPRSGK